MELIDKKKVIRVGVCVALFNKKREILLTRRAKRMRTFPQRWVIPF